MIRARSPLTRAAGNGGANGSAFGHVRDRRERRQRRGRAASARSGLAGLAAALSFGLVALAPEVADAQQQTFHLDRLEVPGAPDDGVAIFRPETLPENSFYAQLALGFALNPLRTTNITNFQPALRASPADIITTQFSTYLSAGFELFDRLTLGLTFPIAWGETGNQPTYPGSVFGNASNTVFSTTGPAVGDMRLDARYVVLRNERRDASLGLQFSVRVPTGNGSASNFGGDGSFSALPMVTGEWTPARLPLTFVANLGVDFRHDNSINNPAGTSAGPVQGLGIGDELRWAVGVFIPIKKGLFRLAGTLFGQTGLTDDHTTGPTFFTARNTPMEWNAEVRMRLPVKELSRGNRWYAGVSGGTLILPGYGAPDLRLLALVGMYLPIEDTNPHSPPARDRIRESIHESMKDTDGDGIPDDIDACPTEPEDHKDPDPNDGCPAPSDRDGDGIPDQFDKCPDEPEDKDGIQDQDGCPEDDADQDGIPDTKDACPREPGMPDADPKKNGCPKFIKLEGSTVRVLQQVHFQTASATILPDSFPMLGEIVALLKANPSIKKMRIEGHTDNRGNADYNLDLSKRRAASVLSYLVGHGLESSRLESEGYGLTKPIESNDTEEGRLANRRVEFKILEDSSSPSP
jgi:outer membrane protein OmpA-like peptidoglycan-associated protein